TPSTPPPSPPSANASSSSSSRSSATTTRSPPSSRSSGSHRPTDPATGRGAPGVRPTGGVRQAGLVADPGVAELVLVSVAVGVGAGTQRLTGLGFALVSAPFLVLLLGPFTGVLLANALSLATNVVVLGQTWRAVEVRKALFLAVPAVAAVVPGAWVARSLPAPVLALTAGGLVLVALVAVLASERARVLRGTPGAVVAGAASGFMNVTAGVGGPAISLYGLSTGWPHAPFVATVQLYFVVLNGASIVA